MFAFSDISIKRKLTFIIMVTSTITLVLAGAAYFTYDVLTLRDAMVRNVTMLSEIIGANSTADIVFGDQKSAEENLAKLGFNPHIVASCIYGKGGEIFASYLRKDMAGKLTLPALHEDGHHFGTDSLTQFRRIYLDNKPVGAVYLQYDLSELRARVLRFVVIVFVIMLAGSCVAFLLSSRLQRVISEPLLSLAETARMISREKNFSLRAKKHGQDEIGILIDGFNDMLAQIQERDTKLAQHSEQLEEVVASRTAELKEANAELRTQIAEKQRIEEELFRTRHLESLGILAGGIAHDFNNLLTAIMGNTSLAKMFTEPDTKIYARLEEVEKASLRARDLTQQLLTFSKGGAPIKKVTSIADIICDSSRFALRGSHARCKFNIMEDLWPVEVDEGQISQVISNLAINADQAMPEGGVVEIRAENVTLLKGQVVTLEPGRYIRLSITDSGIGIPKDHLNKIFTPYFTTKQRGSGLGLATSYSIINKHGGVIIVESEIGRGTTFNIYLPASGKEIPEKEKKSMTTITGSGKILVMDDEEFIRNTAGEMLATVGYTVGYADDGAQAIDLYLRARESGEPYDLIIMDLTIPGGMGGVEAIQKLLEIAPDAKAIVSSGYANGPIMADFKEYGFKGVIAKPYRTDELCKVVQTVIF
ncbi:MAG: ATP-binding protein [Geobacteraceae bacterium]|jgi:signal transduction histidine kinase/CheY-like chemotaxis protein